MKITIDRKLKPIPCARKTLPTDPARRIELWSTDLHKRFAEIRAVDVVVDAEAPNVSPMRRKHNSAKGLA